MVIVFFDSWCRTIKNKALVEIRGLCCFWGLETPPRTCHIAARTLVNVRQGRKLLAPLLQRNIHISLPLILRCLGIGAQIMKEQRLVTKFLSTGRKPIAVNRIDRFADVIR